MRAWLSAAALCPLLPVAAAAQTVVPVGEYRLAEGPDAAGAIRLFADGRFRYGLSVGALDEFASGRWEQKDGRACLYTEPKPVPPSFTKADPVPVDGTMPTLFVSLPDGAGFAGVYFVIGFDDGDTISGYTQYDGWTMPDGDPRVPRWIDLREPIYHIAAPRFELAAADGGKLHARLVPNDMGTVDFDGACLEARGDAFILHRPEGEMRFVRSGEP